MGIKLVKQEAPMGCELACFAMLTGRTYQEARDFIAGFEHFRADDQLPTCHYMQLLYDHGYYKRREYSKSFGSPRNEWPPAPFANVHWCSVRVNEGSQYGHAVVMLADGSVLDPLCDEPRTLKDYAECWSVSGLIGPVYDPGCFYDETGVREYSD